MRRGVDRRGREWREGEREKGGGVHKVLLMLLSCTLKQQEEERGEDWDETSDRLSISTPLVPALLSTDRHAQDYSHNPAVR